MNGTRLERGSPKLILTAAVMLSALPFLLIEVFPSRLNVVIDKASYLVFHNTAEFFSIMVSLSIFGVGWFTFEQSRDRGVLFLSVAFLAIGLLDFMHTMSNAAMPAFITPNSSNKSTQFWIAARLFQASAFLISVFVYPETPGRGLSKVTLMTSGLLITGTVFAGIIFFPAYVPDTFVAEVGLTPFKKNSEYLVIVLSFAAALAYWRRMERTGDRLIIYYLVALAVSIFGETAFAVYTRVFDTYNALGHIYKVASFSFLYAGLFASSVKKPHLELSNANEEIKRINAELEQRVVERTAELSAANKELEAFAYSVSHDLRAPLRAVDGFSRMLEEDFTAQFNSEGKRLLGVVRSETKKMGQLIDDLLSFSRIGRREMSMAETSMEGLACSVCEEVRQANPSRQIEFRTGTLPPARGDSAMLRQVFVNLISNAVKYTRPRETAIIEVNGRAEAGENVYFIKDNGVGFDMQYAHKLFGVFQRLHSSEEFEGTGVGLAIVQRIIHRHGGRVWAEGAVGQGAVFSFALRRPA